MTGQPFTREKLVEKLKLWRAIPEQPTYSDDELAEAILSHGIDQVMVGVHDGRGIKGGVAFLLLTGRRLSL